IVRLALRTRSPPSRPCRGLRLAVWYPTISPQKLSMNENSILPRDFYTVGYKPMIWFHFGGAGRKNVRHLTGISAALCAGILRIHLSFNIEVPWEYRSFGRLKIEEEYEDRAESSIDGPGGEHIETIKTRHYYPSAEELMPGAACVQEGYMVRCKYYTNRGRSCRLFRMGTGTKGPVRRSAHTEVTATPGTVIAGLYGNQVRKIKKKKRKEKGITLWQVPVANVHLV
ncbi:hypothetical protein N657DRAFT_571053, partial [Parathielavia appendiculata]